MERGKFESEYKKLNSDQKKAVDAVEGTVMVIAGPGTGKTQILSLRTANILRKTDTNPENILALTFTNAGVFSMRKRLSEIIGADSYRVNIFTFHGFCENLANEYGEEYQNILGAKLISSAEQLKIIEEIIKTGSFKLLKPWGNASYYVDSLPTAISELKKEAITVEKLKAVLAEQEKDFLNAQDIYHTKGKWKGQMKNEYQKIKKDIEKNKEVANLYEKYQKVLRENRLYDYDDVILETIKTMENNKIFLLTLQEKYQYILVDEHQDTNNAQNRILELLTNFFDRPNLFVVGDERQAIYRFQGASLENFTFFKNKYKDVLIINLLKNYRSAQNILDVAHSLISKSQNSDEQLNVKLKSVLDKKGTKVFIHPFSTPESEFSFLARDIKNKISQGTKLDAIAIFYRQNSEVFDIARAMEKAGIPFVVESKQDILADPDIFKILLLVKTINYLGENSWLGQALHIDFLGIDSLDIYKLIQYSYKQKMPLFDCIASEKILKKIGVGNAEKIFDFYKKLEMWKKAALNKDLVSCLEDIIYQSGCFNYILKTANSADKLHKLNKFFDEAKKIARENRNFKLTDFVKFLELLESYNLPIKTKNSDLFEGARLMTAHSAKGLEFDSVYIINATDKHWGNRIFRNKFNLPLNTAGRNGDDDERRLFFVALTRARKEVIITYAEKKYDGRDQMPTQFLAEIDDRFVEKRKTAKLESDFLKENEKFGKAAQRKNNNLKDKEYLNKLFLKQGLNATKINNYLKCPWRYFFNNLVCMPMAYHKSLAYGTAVHNSLEEFFENFRRGKKTNKKMLLNIFKKNTSKGFLNESDKKEALKKGLKALGGYYDAYNKSWKTDILNEFNIKGIPIEIAKDTEIFLSGKLDKIEMLDGKEVKVIDYKTGKIKSKNRIEGQTKNSSGNYKRQLIFYKLLLDKYNNRQYKMTQGEIDFIEPNERGKYKKEVFEITDKETKELEKEIKQIAKEILNLSFWNKKCGDKNCEFCKLREMMK